MLDCLDLYTPIYCTALTECKHPPDIHHLRNDWVSSVFGHFAMETNLQLTQLECLSGLKSGASCSGLIPDCSDKQIDQLIINDMNIQAQLTYISLDPFEILPNIRTK